MIKKFAVNFFIYILIVAGMIYGLPRFLSWALATPYPMAAITSGSMWPTFDEGALVFIQGVSSDALEVGDVIVYRSDASDGFTIHRIVELEEDTITTKGDANFSEDQPISYDDVVGRTFRPFGGEFHIPYLGSITVFASNLK